MERFLKIPHRVFLRLVRLSRRGKCPSLIPVYLALLYHADRRGRCFPGYERIVELSGVGSRSTVAKALRILEAHGLLEVSRESGGVNRYVLGSPVSGLGQSSDWTGVVQRVDWGSPVSGLELDPINYNHLTIPKELERGERGKSGSDRKRPGMPESEELDAEYYLS